MNWDSGVLRLEDAVSVVKTFLQAAGGHLAGADLLGDWSPVRLADPLQWLCHWLDHPGPDHEPGEAARRNQRANAVLLQALREGSS